MPLLRALLAAAGFIHLARAQTVTPTPTATGTRTPTPSGTPPSLVPAGTFVLSLIGNGSQTLYSACGPLSADRFAHLPR